MAFDLNLFPWSYLSQYTSEGWSGEFIQKGLLSPEEFQKLSDEKRGELLTERNSFGELPLINYTTQYGMGCFEGIKAYPQKDGTLKVFRLDENAKRMHKSMCGLRMPPVSEEMFIDSVLEVLRRNEESGFSLDYDPKWQENHYAGAEGIYIRPFSYSEAGIGVALAKNPYFIVVATPVGAYFEPEKFDVCTSKMARATPHGTGWIKAASNYTISALAKEEAQDNGFFEAVFLDAREQKYIEEGSSCNILFRMSDNSIVTPALGDTILPGITRKSVLALAQKAGLKTEERKISLEEVFDDAEECILTGTAVSLCGIGSLTHNGRRKDFVTSNGSLGQEFQEILFELKGIQYGEREDTFNWMIPLG